MQSSKPSYLSSLPTTVSNDINNAGSYIYNFGTDTAKDFATSLATIAQGLLGTPTQTGLNPNILNEPVPAQFATSPNQTYGQYLSSTPQGQLALASATKPYSATQTLLGEQLYGGVSPLGPNALNYALLKTGEYVPAAVFAGEALAAVA